MGVSAQFADGLQQLNLSLDPSAQRKLLLFLDLLQKWNRHYNLTAITDPQKMISHHLLDSLSIVPFIQGENILDVGSGAGFPGIPLAVYFPHKEWTLIDSNGKKARFLTQAKAELQLPNVYIVHDRVERWRSLQKFAAITVRAVGDIKSIMAQTQQHLQPGGRWLFMKGECASEELDDLPPGVITHRLQVPGVSTPRRLIVIQYPCHD